MSNNTQLTPEKEEKFYLWFLENHSSETSKLPLREEILIFARLYLKHYLQTLPTADTKVSGERKTAEEMLRDRHFFKYITSKPLANLMREYAAQEVAHALAKQPQPGGEVDAEEVLSVWFDKFLKGEISDRKMAYEAMIEYGNLREAAAKVQWRPIEEAPRDTKKIHAGAYWPGTVGWVDELIYWSGEMWSGWGFHFKPTHWQPLLAPPTIPNPTNKE